MNPKRTTRIILIVLLFVAVLSTILYYFAPRLSIVYSAKLQTPLFTGFLTLGSFLLTLKTFILVQLKEKLYDDAGYIERIARLRFQNASLKLYAPIMRLAELLLIAVVMALGTALLQITLGFVEHQISSAICLSFAMGTLFLVGFAWWQIRKNIYDLFQYWDEQKEKEIQVQHEKLKPSNHS